MPKGPDTPQMLFGSAVHKVLEHLNQYRMLAGEYPPPDWIYTVAAEVFQTAGFSPGAAVGLVPEACRLVRTYLDTLAHQLEPARAEQTWLMETPHGARFFGVIDVTEPGAVWDYKVTGKPVVVDEEKLLQINTYAAAFVHMTGRWPRAVGFINFVRGTGTVQLMEAPVTQESVRQTLDNLGVECVTISKAESYPATPGRSCQWCSFLDICSEGKQHVLKGR